MWCRLCNGTVWEASSLAHVMLHINKIDCLALIGDCVYDTQLLPPPALLLLLLLFHIILYSHTKLGHLTCKIKLCSALL